MLIEALVRERGDYYKVIGAAPAARLVHVATLDGDHLVTLYRPEAGDWVFVRDSVLSTAAVVRSYGADGWRTTRPQADG
jgi:hypothetical protein